MRHAIRIAALSLALCLPLAGPVSADQFDDGVAADNSGDYATALQLWQALAEQDNAEAQANLGYMYENGWGVPLDNAAAMRWYRRAADQGDAEAQYNLGNMYALGKGVPPDGAAALKWYRLAADQGIAKAQDTLGSMFLHGGGVPQDYTAAMKWYRLAAEQGDAFAQLSLGNMYNMGHGVPQDYVQAYMWVSLSADQLSDLGGDDNYILKSNGNDYMVKYRDHLAAKMTPADISRAQKLESEWRPKNWDELKGQLP